MIFYAFAVELTEVLGDEMLEQQVLARIARRLPGDAVWYFPLKKYGQTFRS